MPPAQSAKKGGSSKKASTSTATAAAAAAAAEKAKDVQETEDPLQAVILADSFETRFDPLTLETPHCLLPLANTPLIEYSLEYLASSGVDEVYIYCAAHNEDTLDQYISGSKWCTSGAAETTVTSPFQTVELIRSGSLSVGDAMRDLDKRGIMGKDFIVLYGDLVSNLPLADALAEHRARRQTNKNAIMTMVLREASGAQQYRAALQTSTSPVFVIEPRQKRCLHYEQISSRLRRNRHVEIDAELLTSHQELDIRHDLVDAGIDICTPDVLALWTDNFDYEAPRRGFLHSVLKDYELNGKTIHTYISKDYYAARARNLRAYDAVTRAVVSRWTYPFTPDANLYGDHRYRFYKGNVIKEDGVKISRTSRVGPRTVLGRGSSLAEGTKVESSVLGRNCSIGKNCVVENAYLFDNVTLREGTEVRHALVAANVTIGKNARVQNGALVSYGVQVGDGVIVGKKRRLTRIKKDVQPDSAVVGEGGLGYDFHGSSSEEEEEDDDDDDDEQDTTGPDLERESLSLPIRPLHQSLSTDSISTLHSEIDELEMTSEAGPFVQHHRRTSSDADAISITSSRGSLTTGADSTAFLHDATSSLYDSLQKGYDVSTMQLELQGLRMSANASEHQVRRAVVTALTRHIFDTRKANKQKTVAATVKQILTQNKLLIDRTLYDQEAEEKEDQVDFLLLAQSELAKLNHQHSSEGEGGGSVSQSGEGGVVLLSLCNELYMMDVMEQEGLEQWWENEKSTATESLRNIRSETEKFMAALAEAESEESEDEDEDDNNDDDE